LLLLSLLASAQCVARCAAMPCDQSSADLPPCHRHSAPAPKVCATPLFVVSIRTHAAPQLAVHEIATVSEFAVPSLWQPLTRAYPPSPLPDRGGPSITIRRI
jgi:hypothetical protein